MERIIIEAYHKAKDKSLFSITSSLERLLRRQALQDNLMNSITTGQVKKALLRHGLNFNIG